MDRKERYSFVRYTKYLLHESNELVQGWDPDTQGLIGGWDT